MYAAFETIHNHHERLILAAVAAAAPEHPHIAASQDLLADVACVALNRVPPRYIRHVADMAFYLTDQERLRVEEQVDAAVKHAFAFVQARAAK